MKMNPSEVPLHSLGVQKFHVQNSLKQKTEMKASFVSEKFQVSH